MRSAGIWHFGPNYEQGGKAFKDRVLDETLNEPKITRISEESPKESGEIVTTKKMAGMVHNLIIPEALRGNCFEAGNEKESLDKATYHTDCYSSQNNSSMKTSLAEMTFLDDNSNENLVQGGPLSFERRVQASKKSPESICPFEGSPGKLDLSKRPDSVGEQISLFQVHGRQSQADTENLRSYRSSFKQIAAPTAFIMSLEENTSLSLQVSLRFYQFEDSKLVSIKSSQPSDEDAFTQFEKKENKITKEDLELIQSHFRKSYSKNCSQEDILLIVEAYKL